MMNVPNPALLGDLASVLLDAEAIARAAKESGKAAGPVTGFSTLSKELGGFLAPGIHTLLAAPGAGKTALALQIAGTCDCPALYVTSEMPRIELMRRVVARTTGTYLGRMRGGQLTDDELRARIKRAFEACPMLAIYDGTLNPATADDLQKKADALRKRFDSQHVVLIIDSVTDWSVAAVSGSGADAGSANEYTMAEGALNGLKQVAANLSCPVIAIAHRNRVGQNAKGADRLHTGKATGRYEYVSESVWDLERDVTQEANLEGQTRAMLTILKNRHGSTGMTISLGFEGRLQKFVEA